MPQAGDDPNDGCQLGDRLGGDDDDGSRSTAAEGLPPIASISAARSGIATANAMTEKVADASSDGATRNGCTV
jgi:hypothetical protein